MASYEINDRDIDFEIAAEPEQAYQTNRELNMASRIVSETGANLFLTGKAGTGKTTFLRHLRKNCHKRMVVLAPTGVAAINAEGQTIHSFFKFPFSPYVMGRGFAGENHPVMPGRMARRIIATLDLLVIDEVSMVRPDILDAIDSVLRRYRDPSYPFGGVQLLLIGDLRQLPPVIKEEEWRLVSRLYTSPYFFDSIALRQAGFVTIELTTVYRQSQREFIEILNAVRDGRADASVLARLNTRYKPGFEPADSEGYIRLTTHNRLAADINSARLAANPSEPHSFEAVIRGRFPESAYPADKTLTLKLGAQVMFVKNDSSPAHRYYNGMIGTVTELGDDTVKVTPMGSAEAISVVMEKWENTSYTVDGSTKDIKQNVDGEFMQIPLRLAWAITIHKSQGLTFDRAIINAAASFAPGQAYVALSRCRSLEGMVLDSPVPPSAVITDRSVNAFMEQSAATAPDEACIARLKGEYCRRMLSDVFDFEQLDRLFADYSRAVSEYVIPIYRELAEPYRAAQSRMTHSILEVGRTFASRFAAGPVSEQLMADPRLAGKVRGGCRYFIDQLMAIVELLNKTPVELDNSSYEERLARAREPLEYVLVISVNLLKKLLDKDFTPRVYMEAKAKAILEAEGGRRIVTSEAEGRKSGRSEPRAAKERKERKERKPKGYSQYETLRMFRMGKSPTEIAEERNLKPGTVYSHLVQAVNGGDLQLTELMDDDTINRLDAFEKAHPYDGTATVKEHYAEAGVDMNLVYIWRSVRQK